MNTKHLKYDLKVVAVKSAALLLVALVANHLIAPEYFPLNADYVFPSYGFFFTLIGGVLVLLIGELCFRWFSRRYFAEGLTPANMFGFVLSVLGVITIIYIPAYFVSSMLMGSGGGVQYLLSGLLMSLLLSCMAVLLIYAKPLYEIHRNSLAEGRLKVRSGRLTEFVIYDDIAYFFSVEKVVYLVRKDGRHVVTDFTLNHLEEKLSNEIFFRANRQAIIHRNGVGKLKPDKNGKLMLGLVTPFNNDSELMVSRYKAKALKDWLETA